MTDTPSTDGRGSPPVDHGPAYAGASPAVVTVPLGITPGAGILTPGATAVQLQVWQGQFPPPDAVEAYERVSPGSFNRLIAMAEQQQAASIELNRDALAGARADNRRGHYLGAAVTFSAIAGAVISAWLQHPAVAAILCGVPVLSVANLLVTNARGVAAVKAATPPTSQPHAAAPPPDDVETD